MERIRISLFGVDMTSRYLIRQTCVSRRVHRHLDKQRPGRFESKHRDKVMIRQHAIHKVEVLSNEQALLSGSSAVGDDAV
jgi:hypothetical protein